MLNKRTNNLYCCN